MKTRPRRRGSNIFAARAGTLLCLLSTLARGGEIVVTPEHADGIYQTGQTIQWRVETKGELPSTATFSIKRGSLTEIASGTLTISNDTATVQSKLDEPGSLLLVVNAKNLDGSVTRAVGGAIVAPEQIKPSADRPADFDDFWSEKIAELPSVPLQPQRERCDSGSPDVDYWKVTLDHLHGAHIYGQLARPSRDGKFPALLIVQWAGVYALEKPWVVGPAANGWLVFNISAHDLPIDEPAQFYKDQYDGPLKNYWAIGNDHRDTSYYLRMYLSCYRAADYLASRNDWDGHTLVVMGGSQGGMQALVTAALHPKITAALAVVPAGCDMLGPDVGRAPGWPQWYDRIEGKDASKVRQASRYFDVVNFAPRIKCPVLIAAGLVDEVCPPEGIISAANHITAPKELILMPRAAHQEEDQSHSAYLKRCWEQWLPALKDGKAPPVSSDD